MSSIITGASARRRTRNEGPAVRQAFFVPAMRPWYHAGMKRAGLIVIAFLLAASQAAAFAPSDAVRSASVLVACGGRKGGGSVTSAADGYVVTAGHIVIDSGSGEQASSCVVGVPHAPSFEVRARYSASVVHAVLDRGKDLDFAVLRVGGRLSGPSDPLPPELPTNEYVTAGEEMAALGYPGSFTAPQHAEGTVLGFERGFLLSDAAIEEGYSGGPAVDAEGRLVGVAARIRYVVNEENGERQVVDHGFGDVASLIGWLDRVDPEQGHDGYVRHADPDRYHALPYFIRDEGSGCDDVVRTVDVETVYCLRTGSERSVFPDAATFFSWFDGFGGVKTVSPEALSTYRLTGLVTHRAGGLVKIQSDPRVYLVSDDIGTLRWITSESRAAELFGTDWASKVVDVPESFFPAYVVGPPL